MTISEAVQLVIQASAIKNELVTYMLKYGGTNKNH